MDYPAVHALLYGETGSRKSALARTFPKPMLVFHFDPLGKDTPYLRSADWKDWLPVSEFQTYPLYTANGETLIKYRDVQDPEGVIRLEYYHDEDPDDPFAINAFRYRLALLHHEYAVWKTIVTDSVTFMEMVARKWEEKVMNPMQKFAKGTDTRQWFSGSTDTLEELLVMRYAGLPMNVVICCHIDERTNMRNGEILRGPFAPGRLSKRGELAAAFQEQYHLYTARGEDGQLAFLVQTINDGNYACTTQIDAPNNCYPHYLSLWANYRQ